MQETLSAAEALPLIEKALSEYGLCRLVVTGGSMLPFLHNRRDAVYLEPLSGPARPGDIFLYRRNDHFLVLHRVHRIARDGSLLFTGDMQSRLERVQTQELVARVQSVEEKGKKKSCDAFAYRLRTALWHPTRPLRPLMARVYLFLRTSFGKNC